jgi:hypothetical protein
MKNFLCVVYDKKTNLTLAEYTVEADDWYFARHQAAGKFKLDFPEKQNLDWKVDSLEIS